MIDCAVFRQVIASLTVEDSTYTAHSHQQALLVPLLLRSIEASKRNLRSTDSGSQIENFAKKEGADVYGKFIQSVNQRTTLGVTDGNRLAATALFANQPYVQFGLQPSPAQPGEALANPLDQVATSNFRLDFDGGYSHTDIGSGYYATGAVSLGFKFGQSVGLVFTTPFEYRYIAGATAYDIGEEVSLPVVIIPPRGQTGLSWMLTPTVFAGGVLSQLLTLLNRRIIRRIHKDRIDVVDQFSVLFRFGLGGFPVRVVLKLFPGFFAR